MVESPFRGGALLQARTIGLVHHDLVPFPRGSGEETFAWMFPKYDVGVTTSKAGEGLRNPSWSG